MRLCLDEHYAPHIAVALRERSHDVIAVAAHGELRGVVDEELLAFCVSQRRALLSEDASDFVPLVHELAARGDDHYGLVLTSATSMPRRAATIGIFIEALDRLLRDHPSDNALRNQVRWLQPTA